MYSTKFHCKNLLISAYQNNFSVRFNLETFESGLNDVGRRVIGTESGCSQYFVNKLAWTALFLRINKCFTEFRDVLIKTLRKWLPNYGVGGYVTEPELHGRSRRNGTRTAG